MRDDQVLLLFVSSQLLELLDDLQPLLFDGLGDPQLLLPLEFFLFAGEEMLQPLFEAIVALLDLSFGHASLELVHVSKLHDVLHLPLPVVFQVDRLHPEALCVGFFVQLCLALFFEPLELDDLGLLHLEQPHVVEDLLALLLAKLLVLDLPDPLLLVSRLVPSFCRSYCFCL